MEFKSDNKIKKCVKMKESDKKLIEDKLKENGNWMNEGSRQYISKYINKNKNRKIN